MNTCAWLRCTSPLWFFVAVACTACSEGLPEAGECSNSGFVSLFDGKTLDGWHAVPEDTSAGWTVRDGVIVGKGIAKHQSFLVWKDDRLTDFELELQYRLFGKCNTGIEVRARPDSTGKRLFEGYQADLGHVGIGDHILGAWDFHFGKDTRQEPPCPRGTRLVIDENGKLHSSRLPNAVSLGDIHREQWNHVRVVARGNTFQFYINNKIASEFTDNAEGRLTCGAIGLQVHDPGMHVEFKDIRLRRLDKKGSAGCPQ